MSCCVDGTTEHDILFVAQAGDYMVLTCSMRGVHTSTYSERRPSERGDAHARRLRR